MNIGTIALWIVQALLGFVFFMAGIMKLTQPEEKLLERMKFIEDVGMSATRIIGLLEVLGALGLILPVLLNILPFLTPVAALGLMIVMVGAILTHLRRQEFPDIIPNLVLGGLAAVVFFGYLSLLTDLFAA